VANSNISPRLETRIRRDSASGYGEGNRIFCEPCQTFSLLHAKTQSDCKGEADIEPMAGHFEIDAKRLDAGIAKIDENVCDGTCFR
jgi:hypothetical protein